GGLITTLNLTTLTTLGGTFNCSNNSSLTTITLPASNVVITFFIANDCNLTYFDFTVLTANNSNINIDLSDNSMTAAEVNHILVDLDSTGWINGVLNIAGTNAA